MFLRRFTLLYCLLAVRLTAQDSLPITADEIARAPTSARIEAFVDRAKAQGWGSVTPVLRVAAQRAYETNSGYARNWYYLYRWSALWGTTHQQALENWIKAVEASGGAHRNMATSYASRAGSLAGGVSRELQVTLLSNHALSEEFFPLLSPLDSLPEVLAILQRIFSEDPVAFASHGNLAVAIAVVYDIPPHPQWPHGQVTNSALPRKLPSPEQVFAYFVRLDRSNAASHRLTRLPASELKFLVDVVAPFSELDWARKNVPQGLMDFGKAYDLVAYRKDRLSANQYTWPAATYALDQIRQQGGICVDQAYFASTAGKAKGIPTLLFRGAGLDGRHAWFGYLDANQRWQLDCGRYAEQKYVVGLAFDPQTWQDINDHELRFITERFRALPTYKLSVLHKDFAEDYLHEGKVDLAFKAAREAVNRDPRNLAAWHVLLQAQTKRSPDLRAREALLREAALAFQRYPDLEIGFSRQLVDSLRQRGETSLAAVEEQRLGQRYQATREDLSVQQAALKVRRSMQSDDLATQIKIFNQVLDTSGRGATIDFFDQVVAPFALHLASREQIPAAMQVLERARRTLRVEPGKQLDQELAGLTQALRTGSFSKKSAGQ